MMKIIVSSLLPAACALLLGGCGLDVGAAAGASGTAAAESAKDAKGKQEKIEQGLEDAQAEAARLREQAEAASQ